MNAPLPAPLPETDPELEHAEPGGRPSHEYVERLRHTGAPARLPYLRTRTRAAISFAVAAAWVALSVVVSAAWVGDLAAVITLPLAILVITGIAWLPGYLNMQLLVALLFDRPPALVELPDLPDVTVLVAAYNEAGAIERTISSLLEQEYPDASASVLVIDDGSTDDTARIVGRIAELDPRVRLLSVPHGGKAAALNAGLEATEDWIIATVDADTHLHPEALRRAVTRLMMQPHGVAVAGSLLVRNAEDNILTRAQAYDYMLAISSVKREQSLLQSTLVAQGAFSVYIGSAVAAQGGWMDRVGEDIVLTWGLLERGGTTGFEATAIAWTEVPATLRSFARQRRRWARGMFEGLRAHGLALVTQRRLLAHSVAGNMLFPLVDAAFTLAFIPGIILALGGNFLIVGPMTLAVLPVSLAIALTMRLRQRRALAQAGVHPPAYPLGFLAWFLAYQLLLSPVSLSGYLQEVLRRRRSW